MKNYLSLIPISAKKHKKQNRMTLFCILLSVFLVTGVFSMADFEGQNEFNRLAKKHGNWHIAINNISKEEAKDLDQEVKIEVGSWYDTVNYHLENEILVDGKKIIVAGADETYEELVAADDIVKGHMPKKSGEALVTANFAVFGNYDIGDEVTVNVDEKSFTYQIAGFCVQTTKMLETDSGAIILGMQDFEHFLNENDFQYNPVYMVRFADTRNIQKNIAKLKELHSWNDDQVSENAAILGILGNSSNNYINGLYGAAAFLVILVVLAGVLMIAGSMNTNIAERTQYFGMLRCIGASKRQIKYMVRLEALWWCITAIPLGIILATFGANVISAVLKYGIGGEWSEIPVGRISVIGVVAGTVIGIVTVLLAANAPAKKAAKVSPIAAVSGNAGESDSFKKAVKANRLPIEISMGIHHAFSKKKNICLMTGSFALSIILFLSFSVMIDWISHALNTLKPYSQDMEVYYENYPNELSKDLNSQINAIDGIKYAYGRMHINTEVSSSKGVNRIDLISYEERQFDWSKDDFLSGNIEEVRNGNGVMTIFDKNNPLELGDVIYYNDVPLSIVAVLSDSPFSSDDIPVIICSEEYFTKLTGIDEYAIIDIHVQKGARDSIADEVRSLLDEDMKLSDGRKSKAEVNSTYQAFCFLVYGFLSIVALITVFNIINSISMSAEARYGQNCVMHSIGMESKQINRMILSESLSYAVTGCFVGCILGLPLHAKAFQTVIGNYWGDAWKVPIKELLIIVSVVLISAIIAARRVRFRSVKNV